MDKSLLKKTAVQSLAVMIAVITLSYTLTQYKSIKIEASNIQNEASKAIVTTAPIDTAKEPEVTPSISVPEPDLTVLELLTNTAEQSIINQLGDKYLVIKKPIGVETSLQLEDIYINKSILLTMTGASSEEFTLDMISRIKGEEYFSGEPVFTESVRIEQDEEKGTTKEVITKDYGNDFSHAITILNPGEYSADEKVTQVLIELDTVYAHFIYEDANYYFIDLRKPSEVYDKIIVLDAGHGGKDAGALSKDEEYYEKNINLDILLQLKEMLDQQEDIKVYYTRTADDKVYLRPRVDLVNAVDCDYFISIHCNASVSTSPNGTEIYYHDSEFKGVSSKKLAALFSEELAAKISLDNNGIVEKRKKELFLMNHSLVPMILIEVGYMTNQNDIKYLSQSESRKAAAEGIYNGIMRAYEELPVNN